MQQSELGLLIGKTQGYISKVEGGHQGVDVLLLYDIAVALRHAPQDLFARAVEAFDAHHADIVGSDT